MKSKIEMTRAFNKCTYRIDIVCVDMRYQRELAITKTKQNKKNVHLICILSAFKETVKHRSE